MATIQLRLTGITPLHAASAVVAASPLAYVIAQSVLHHQLISVQLLGLSFVAALVPWLSRAVARATYRAACDDIAVHVRSEALPYKTITEVKLTKNVRRTTLALCRGETVTLELVLADAFAGKLEPIEELSRRLTESGHPIPR